MSDDVTAAAERYADGICHKYPNYEPWRGLIVETYLAGAPSYPPADADAVRAERDALREEVTELRERQAAHVRLRDAVRDDARKALRDAVGPEAWRGLWGPQLEALGSVVYAVWMELERLRAAMAGQPAGPSGR